MSRSCAPLQRDHELRIEESERDDVRRHIAGSLAREIVEGRGNECGGDHLDEEDRDIRKPKDLARNSALEIAEESYPLHGTAPGRLRSAARAAHRNPIERLRITIKIFGLSVILS
jgi:hypothetical protein